MVVDLPRTVGSLSHLLFSLIRHASEGTRDEDPRSKDVAGRDDRSRILKVLLDQHILIVGQGKPTATSQDGAVVLLTPNGQRETRLNGNGITLLDFGGPTDALFGLTLTPT